jgi:hypothetical protein
MTLIESIDSSTNTGEVAKFAWPGGYPIFYITSDGAALCGKCVDDNMRLVLESTLEDARDGWAVVGADVNWEDASLHCENCNARIASAYAEDDADDNDHPLALNGRT